MMHKRLRLRPTLLCAALLAAFPQAQAQTQGDEEAPQLEQKVVGVGSRGAARSALDTAVPVGLVSARDLA
jgi:iron complex outermembrane receptor protein